MLGKTGSRGRSRGRVQGVRTTPPFPPPPLRWPAAFLYNWYSAVCLRFLDNLNPEQPEVKEVFFDFVYLDKTDGESISRAIIEWLSKRGKEITKARGQAHNRASAMSFSRVGVQARIRALVPRALYVHWNSRVLNLSIASSCQMRAIKNMIDTINETFKFFTFLQNVNDLLKAFWIKKANLMQLKNSKDCVKPGGLNGTPVTKPFIRSTLMFVFV